VARRAINPLDTGQPNTEGIVHVGRGLLKVDRSPESGQN
jgi:hypothetical protein